MSAENKTGELLGLGAGSRLTPSVRAFRTALTLAQKLRYAMDERLRVDGLTTQQAALITVVTALGKPSLAEAAAVLGSTHQNVAQIVAALVRKELLQVEPDPADRRRKLLSATERSAEYWRQRDDGDFAAVAGWFGELSAAELETFCDLSDRVIANLAGA
ncbi:MarR family winged helix-turn-helix transcriptional regulator [Kribbella sp. CA-293567]|uniref:MarR family winged helix-turn-helix transcriptional regulator n=1 Tax=Kribbella sp. CA-293567 TaxID=3002436 RepID=UPI0022DD33B6|nr:MarR family transcriptional regulator [Kribbella sp. CA-293567]WBQ06081.1 MarR family transcriptional regulator [Kribbella sp. CA-293567]